MKTQHSKDQFIDHKDGLAYFSLGKSMPNLSGLVLAYPVKNSLCWTIALSPKAKVPTRGLQPKPGIRAKYLPWGSLTPLQQWNFIKYDYVPVIMKYAFGDSQPIYSGYPELTEAGEVHAHLVIYSDNVPFDIVQLRKACAQHKVSAQFHLMKAVKQRAQNFIHGRDQELQDSGKIPWPDYITKHHKF